MKKKRAANPANARNAMKKGISAKKTQTQRKLPVVRRLPARAPKGKSNCIGGVTPLPGTPKGAGPGHHEKI